MAWFGAGAQGTVARRGRRTAGVAVAGAVLAVLAAGGSVATPVAAAGPLLAVPTVTGTDCGHGFYVGTWQTGVRTSFATSPAPGRPTVVQQQRLDLDDASATQDSGAVATIGATLIPRWDPTYPAAHRYRVRARAAYGTPGVHEAWGAWSATPNLLVDGPPPAPVTVSSLDHPTGGLFGAPAGVGSLTVTLPPKAIGFVYAWGRGVAPVVTSSCTGFVSDDAQVGFVEPAHGPTSLPVPLSLGAGLRSLVVMSVDQGGQTSEATRYDVVLPDPTPGATPGSDRIEAETAPVTTSALTYRQSVAGSSGHAERVVVATGPGQSVAVEVTAPLDGRYSLQLAGTGTDHSGTVNVLVDGVVQPSCSTGEPLTVDLYQPVPTHTESFLAGLRLTAGPHTVTLVTTTPDAASRDVVDHGVHDHGSSIGMDFVRVTWLAP